MEKTDRQTLKNTGRDGQTQTTRKLASEKDRQKKVLKRKRKNGKKREHLCKK